MPRKFDIKRFISNDSDVKQYDRQIERLISDGKDVTCIEIAVRGAISNLRNGDNSFIIYGEPQSGKTEMMICLAGKLVDEGHRVIVHLLNDSVDLLAQNLGRFKSSGLAPAARNFSEILDPAVNIRDGRHIIFCKKNGSDLRNLVEKLHAVTQIVVIDDEADYASPNSKVNQGKVTPINDLISQLISNNGIYIGVTATPARLDLNNTFENDSSVWVDFPPHSKYTGQDVFFPIDGPVAYQRTLLPDAGADPKHARKALFSFLVNAAYLNLHVHRDERCYSFLIHTSGKKADHKSDWGVINSVLGVLAKPKDKAFEAYVKAIWELSDSRYSDVDADEITNFILRNISRNAIVVLNSERDWKDNSSAATDPTSLFTIIIGGNIVSRGVTLNNLLSMFFTRDVRHKIQQDTYIQRARMFGNRGDYLRSFELTIPQALYVDWHRCFVFHRLALAAIKEGLGSLVWIGDQRIAPVASQSIDRSTVDLNRGEMSFSLFKYSGAVDALLKSPLSPIGKMTELSKQLGPAAFPDYLTRYIQRTSSISGESLFVHLPLDISGYNELSADKDLVVRKKGFIGNPQLGKAPATVTHHLFVCHNNGSNARLVYKFIGSIQFIKNTSNDARI